MRVGAAATLQGAWLGSVRLYMAGPDLEPSLPLQLGSSDQTLTDGGSSCIGPAQSYRSCNIQDCPEGSRDFRAEQCAEFDGTEFQGKKYKWLPYYGAPNKCELNCIPKGENFYYRQKEAVVDGTPCEPGKNDVCVQGTCRAVGCDKMLDSSQKEDKCLQCGYNQIFVIPMGATSIRIKEATPTRNFLVHNNHFISGQPFATSESQNSMSLSFFLSLFPPPPLISAIKNVQGTYYLNGHWTIEYSQALPIASTVVHYDRGSEGDLAPELLHARGPITEPLIIEATRNETKEYIMNTICHSKGKHQATAGAMAPGVTVVLNVVE
ncbi:hypothetical protein L345_15257, partial [Ophiophagus hannah]